MILIIILLNAILYSFVIYVQVKDCKVIGKERLAVPLIERLCVAFALYTLPSILILVKFLLERGI